MIEQLKERNFSEFNKDEQINILYEAVKEKHLESQNYFLDSKETLRQLDFIERKYNELENENIILKEHVKYYSMNNYKMWLAILICSVIAFFLGGK